MTKIESGDIEGATTFALETAIQLDVPKDLIDKIFSVNLKSYEKKIDEYMPQCIQRAKEENAEALCLYYSLDNGWDSTMYICKGYTKENSGWIGASRSWIVGGLELQEVGLKLGKREAFPVSIKKKQSQRFFAIKLVREFVSC